MNHVPLMLTEILRVVAPDDGSIKQAGMEGAAIHGRERSRQHFDVRELVREQQILREQIFLYLQEHGEQFARHGTEALLSILARVGIAIDTATCETMSAYFEACTDALREMSRTDSLTGLYNHRAFYDRLDEEHLRAERYRTSLCVALIDLDSFKAVNDTSGHQFGDHVLVECAKLMRAAMRGTDVICRHGGDEFSILLPETTHPEADVLMKRLQVKFSELGALEGTPATFGMSFGLAAYPETRGGGAHLVRIADEASNRNKGAGKVREGHE